MTPTFDKQRVIQECAVRAMSSEPRAIEQLFLLLLPRVRNLVRYLLRTDRDVDDLSQEALARIFEGLSSYREEGQFTSWSDRIVARTVFAALRQRRQQPAAPLQPEELSALASHGTGATTSLVVRRQLVRLLEQLPIDQRTALVLHHALGMRVREIADECDVPEETVRSRLRLGKQRLREVLHGEPATQALPRLASRRMAG